MAPRSPDQCVRIAMLGGFRVEIADREVAADDWPARRAVELVQVLALADRYRLLRDQVIDMLWPHLAPEAGAANVRKAAHLVRRALGRTDAVVLRGGRVELFPDSDIDSDVVRFETAADAALRGGDAARCAGVADMYLGDLLPEQAYAEWARERREHLRARYRELLRHAGDWQRLIDADPTDEAACRMLMKAAETAGDWHGAIRSYGRLRSALAAELGLRPSRETEQLYERCAAALGPAEPVLVGRHLELARAHATLQAPHMALLAIRGPGGIGKSRLCREVVAWAREQRWTVVPLQVAADRGPYAPLVQMIERLLRRNPALLDGISGHTRAVLSQLTPLVAADASVGGPLTRHLVVGAVRRLLRAAGPGRVLLVVDDAHLADEATAEALMHVAAAEHCGPFVVLAYRADSAAEVLAHGVARLYRAGSAELLDLAPLSPEESVALVAAAASPAVDASLVERIVGLAAGNPFFLRELARNAKPGPSPELSPTVRDAVAARFVDLDESTRSMLRRLAVAGAELDLPGVLAVTGLPEDEAFSLLDVASAAEVLVASGAGYRFRHELVRRTLVDEVAPHRRAAIHRDAARRLAGVGGTSDAVAAHWLAGGRPGEAVPWLLAAARHAVRLGAFTKALGHLDVLLQHVPEHAEALFLRAEAFEAIGDERAPAAFAGAAAAAPPARRDEIRARQALAAVRAGDPAAAVATLKGVAATSLEGRLAQSLALCGAAAMGFADPALGATTAAETHILAVESGDPAAVVIASWAGAAAAHARGELPRMLRTVLRETSGLPELAISVFDGQLCVAERLLYGGQPYPEVFAFADALEAEADRLNAARGKAFATTFRGEASLLTGDLDAAETDLTTGVRLHRAIGASGGESLALERLAEVEILRGNLDQAHALLDEALAVARDSNLGFHLFDRIYGARITAAPTPAAALAAVEEAESAVRGSMETCPGCRITLAVPAAIGAARAGDLDRAATYEAAADQLTKILMRLPGWYAALHEVRGHRARATGDLIAARANLSAAASAFAEAGHTLDAKRCARGADEIP